jgi:hypothetical protein
MPTIELSLRICIFCEERLYRVISRLFRLLLIYSPLTLARNIVWLGDLNYRIDMDYYTVKSLAEQDNFDTLLAADQVCN